MAIDPPVSPFIFDIFGYVFRSRSPDMMSQVWCDVCWLVAFSVTSWKDRERKHALCVKRSTHAGSRYFSHTQTIRHVYSKVHFKFSLYLSSTLICVAQNVWRWEHIQTTWGVILAAEIHCQGCGLATGCAVRTSPTHICEETIVSSLDDYTVDGAWKPEGKFSRA